MFVRCLRGALGEIYGLKSCWVGVLRFYSGECVLVGIYLRLGFSSFVLWFCMSRLWDNIDNIVLKELSKIFFRLLLNVKKNKN